MRTRFFLLAVLALVVALVALVGPPRPRDLDRAALAIRAPGSEGPAANADELVSRWATASGRLVECAERRRAGEPAERWLLRAVVRLQREMEELPPAADVVLPHGEHALAATRPRLTLEWIDRAGVAHALHLHQEPRLTPAAWAIDVWLTQSFVERELPPAARESAAQAEGVAPAQHEAFVAAVELR